MRIKTSEIHISERLRIEYGDLKDLGESLKSKGQLQTILVHREADGSWELIAGARRFLACQQAGIDEVECLTREGLSELEKLELQIEENIKRKDFTFVEEVRWKEELEKIYEARNKPGIYGTGERSGAVSAIAKKLRESTSNVDRDLELAKGLRTFPELTKEKNKASAYKKLKQLESQILLEVLAEKRKVDIPNLTILEGDCTELLKTLPNESVNLIITDPPYGVDHDESEANKGSLEVFDDSYESVIPILRKATTELFRVARPNSHMYWFFPTKLYVNIFGILQSAGWEVDPIHLVWNKKTANNIYPYQKFAATYESIFFCKKGKRFLSRPSSAVFEYPPPEKKVHPNEKPVELLKEFVELSSVKDEVILDPFAGSGSTGRASLACGRKVVLIEKENMFVNKIKCMEINSGQLAQYGKEEPNDKCESPSTTRKG